MATSDSDNPAVQFDPRHVDTFLSKIHADRDEELRKIQEQVDIEVAKIRKAAYRSARTLVHDIAKTAREREARDRDRYLYKVRAELKREHWKILAELQAHVLARAGELFQAAWRDPARQWGWCRYWLDAAMGFANGAALKVLVCEDAHADVIDKIKKHLDACGDGSELVIEAAAGPGIVILWPDHRLDGTLASHCREVSTEVVEHLAQKLSSAEA